jgi:FkbM family methyltransferase
MLFISYAQNCEDVMLWRALKHVESGFYIDVGACDPTNDSVTRAFYDRGWSGINIEPVAGQYETIRVQRPRDVNLCCAVGDSAGTVDLFESDTRGLATAEQSVIEEQLQKGHKGVYRRVSLRTLADVCREHVSGEVHFLKIDVEGMEEQVVGGADFHKYRPWIVVAEATRPNSTEEVYKQWEGMLLAAGYQYVYTDGINRFYVANERADLLPAFKYPPNVFDGFVSYGHQDADVRAAEAVARIRQVEMTTQQVLAEAQTAKAEAQEAQSKLHQAVAQSERVEAKVQQARVRADQAEIRAQQAEVKAQQSEIKTQQVQVLAQRMELRAQRATVKIKWAKAKTYQAELTAQQAEAREQQAEARAKQAEARAQQAEARAQQAEARAQQTEARTQQAEIRVQEAKAVAARAESEAEQARTSLIAVYRSRSWRVTAGLRWCGRQMRMIRQGGLTTRLKAAPKRIVRTTAGRIEEFLFVRPGLRRHCVDLVRKCGLYDPLRSFYNRCLGRRVIRLSPRAGERVVVQQMPPDPIVHLPSGQLVPRVHQIYTHLSAAIKHHHKESR